MQTAAEVAFHALDANKDGYIGKDEFVASLVGLLSHSNAESLFESLDLDGNGSIDLEEFRWMTQELSVNDIEYAFSFFDMNGHGRVSKKDLRLFFSQRGLIREAELDDMIRALDTDGSSTIDEDEFISWLLRVTGAGVPSVPGTSKTCTNRAQRRRARAAVARRHGAIRKFMSAVCVAGALSHWETTILCQTGRVLPSQVSDDPLSKAEKMSRLEIMSERRIRDLQEEICNLKGFVRHLRAGP
ncbi:unnamed protein product [Symbiodinium sp. CCMP2592]|nr:unnamed protein product [Symbiodinium sp. CCMP2592]